MSRSTLIALLLGLLLVAAPIVRAEDDSYDDEDDDAEAAKPSGDDAEKDVMVLTEKNFDDVIKKHKFVLAEFYAPWCGHCKSLAPHYAKAATQLKSSWDADVVLAKIDATVESSLGQKFGVQGYPTLKWFVDGEMASDYSGPREAEGIVNWIKKKTGPPAVVVETADKLAELEQDNAVIVVGYFKKLSGADFDAFHKHAGKSEDALYVETSVDAVGKAAGLKKHGVSIIKNHKGEAREVVVLDKAVDADSLKDFVTAEKLPLTIEFNQDNSDKIFNSGIKTQLILWASSAELESGHKVFDAYKAVSKSFKGKLVFVTVNNEGAAHEPVTNFFGLKGAKGPVLLGFFMEKNKKYKLSEELSEASIKKFAEGVLDGTAPVEYKSAPIPEDNKDGEVTIVVGKTVESIVFDETKDVLLEVYAPWCGHCKALEPTYKKLAKRFKKVDSIVIAKMDGTENEHPDLEVKGYPTIFFIPAEKGAKPVAFDSGDRSLKGFTKFLKANAKVPFTLPKKSKDDEAAEEAESEAKKEDKDEL
eukprot:CAMPEP_0202858778 /NCGR_PEP_ID=MMETSP1391-20130828/1156_1 /ASSEMBLY_ACC=CAM_ASM_000867 /TAXON_ID=1034604 /ORGANISM="Chlamydomonas leiostraca, Strain SAG 11-49" /LENGTH=530 /DNA_ID=CAMNT_0049537733 /DNA_START=11 /DNA_END=1603 /DNA_ORIENTATION=+